MNEKVKKTLFIIATVLFVVSFCFLEVGMIIESIEAFFKGTTGGIRFFGDQTPYYGLEGVKRVLEGWGFGLLILYLPILLYQIIYLFIILKNKYHSLKNNKDEKKSEKSLSTIIIIWLAILSIIILITSSSNILLSIVFNPKTSSLFSSILVLAEVTTVIYLTITEFIIVVAIIIGIALVFVFCLNNWALMIIFLLSYFIFLTLTFVIIDILCKHIKQRKEINKK